MDTVWYFEKSDIFSLLCPHKFKAYKKKHHIDSYQKNDYIYFAEDAAQKVYLIANGKVKIGYYDEDGTEIIKAILTKGELFGEKAILGISKRSEFAQSIDKTTEVCPVDIDTMHELMRANKNLSISVYKFLGLRFKKLERRLQLLLFKDTKKRLLEFLEELKEDYGYSCPDTGMIIVKHPYTQKDIANLIATSRPTLNILMNELKENNLLQFSRNQIVFK